MCDWGLNIAKDMQDPDGSSVDMQSALSEEHFPRIHAWTQRFRKLADEAEVANTGAGPLREGQEAEDDVVNRILSSGHTEQNEIGIDASDILIKTDGLKAGQKVSVAPADFGFTHKDEGTLVSLSSDEVVIEVEVPDGDGKLRLHYPRVNFKILPVS